MVYTNAEQSGKERNCIGSRTEHRGTTSMFMTRNEVKVKGRVHLDIHKLFSVPKERVGLSENIQLPHSNEYSF